MKRFSVPVIYTTVGWIEIQAKDRDAAEVKAEQLNIDGIDYFSIEDADCESSVEVDDMEEME